MISISNTSTRAWKSEPEIRFEPQKPTGMDDQVVLYFRGVKIAEEILQRLPLQYVRRELIHQMSGPRIDNAANSIYSKNAENTLEKLVVTLFEMRFLGWANKHSRSFTTEQLNTYYNSSWLKDKMTISGKLTEEGKIFLKELIKNPGESIITVTLLQLDLDIGSPPSLESLSDEDIQTNQSQWVIGNYQPRDLYAHKSENEVNQALKQYDVAVNDEYSNGTVTQISSTLVKHEDGFIEKVPKRKMKKQGHM